MKPNEKLGRELFGVGLAKRRHVEGFSDKKSWRYLLPSQKTAWIAIGGYVLKKFGKIKHRQ